MNEIHIGIVGCSNGQDLRKAEQNRKLFQFLEAQGLEASVSRYLYRSADGAHPSARKRAEE